MENLPKKNIFKTPEGYFDNLPDQVLKKNKIRKSRAMSFVQMTAAAAVVVVGVFFYVIKNDIVIDQSIEANLDQEIDFYINSGHWEAEDILTFSDNPNLILDEIIKEEWGIMDDNQSGEETGEWW
jgi:hypothetical protein